MKTIDLTPTWRALLPALVEVAVRGTDSEGRKQAMDALYGLCDFVDKHNAKVKAREPLKGEEAERDEILDTLMKDYSEGQRRAVTGGKPNAWVCVEGDRIGIYPETGGALFAQIDELRADIAPGH